MKKISYSKIALIGKLPSLFTLLAAGFLPGLLSAQPLELEALEIKGPDFAARSAEGRKPPVNAFGAPVQDGDGRGLNYTHAKLAAMESMAQTAVSGVENPAYLAPQGFVPAVPGGSPFWQYALYGSGIGLSNIIVGPQPPQGGGREIILGGTSSSNFEPNDFWKVIHRNSATGAYDHLFVSPIYSARVKRIAVADLAGDFQPEIVVMLADGRIYFYDLTTKDELGCSDTRINGLEGLSVTDLDGDGFPELIVTTVNDLFVLSSDGTPQWQLAGAGGFEVVAGQMDSDPALEIATTKGFVVDAATRTAQWTRRGSFGPHLKLAPLSGASYQQLIVAHPNVQAYDVAAQVLRWSITVSSGVDALEVADVDRDGMPDLIIGAAQRAKVQVHDLNTQALKWDIINPEHGVTNIAVGDVDNDGFVDLLWGAGWTSTAADYLYVANTIGTREIKWQSVDLVGPLLGPLIGDLDGDGNPELVVCSYMAKSRYESGRILVFDLATMALRGISAPVVGNFAWTGVHDLKLRDLEGDGRMEIVVAADRLYDGVIEIYGFNSSNTFTLKWTNTTRPSGSPFNFVDVVDLDGNGTLEIIAGNTVAHSGSQGVYVYIYDYPSGTNPWTSLNLATGFKEVTGLVVEDLDGDGTKEFAALISSGDLYTFDGLTRELESVVPQSSGKQLHRRIPSGLISGDSAGVGHFLKYSDSNYAEVFSRQLGLAALDGISVLSNGELWAGSGGMLTLRAPPFYESVEWQSAVHGPGFGRFVATDYRNGQARVFSSARHIVAGFAYESSLRTPTPTPPATPTQPLR